MMGWIPTSTGNQAQTALAPAPAEQAPAQPAAVQAQPESNPVVKKTAPKPQAAKAEKPLTQAEVAQATMVPPPPPPAETVRKVCRECAVIESVLGIEKAGTASGAGAVGGAVVGGVLGHQTGGGRGKDVMTVLGALGGGLAGNQIEKNAKKTLEYQITVRYEDGSKGLFTQSTPPSWREGDKVRVLNGAIQPNNG
jgi:outer membrane lipoprotein SlyB